MVIGKLALGMKECQRSQIGEEGRKCREEKEGAKGVRSGSESHRKLRFYLKGLRKKSAEYY
jgi:hypothetical protein